MITKIVMVMPIVVVAFAGIVALRPSEFRVTRTARMRAPASAIFAQVNDFHKWEAWNPWGKLDPAMKQEYQGAPGGTGAVYTWAGNKEVGEGRMTIIESRPNDLIRINLEFFRPFAATNIAEFSFRPEGDQTAVTWSMSGKNNFMGKAIHLFMNMDKMIGTQFEHGLAQMNSIVEAASNKSEMTLSD
jgi:Polyketide cyclase / dehydrase and lipid transport